MKIYWDTSIYDQVSKGANAVAFLGALAVDGRLLFSYENIEEFNRGGDALLEERLSIIRGLRSNYLSFSYPEGEQGVLSAELSDMGCDEVAEIVHNDGHLRSVGNFGFGDLLQHLMGGLRHENPDQMAEQAKDSFSRLLDSIGSEVEGVAFAEGRFQDAQTVFDSQVDQAFSATMGEDGAADFSFKNDFGIDPKIINNLRGPRALERLFEVMEKSSEALGQDGFVGVLFDGIPRKKSAFVEGSLSKEKIATIVMLLNLVGYVRESKLVSRRARSRQDFVGAQSDASHIANAACCDLFITGDEKQALHAAAIYDHFSLGTIVLHCPPRGVPSVVYEPSLR